MAGRGPAPKPKSERRRRNAPTRGEWVELPAVDPADPILPELPKRPRGSGRWHARTIATWEAWRQDPATTQYGPAEIAAAVELAFIHTDAALGDEKWSEVRLRMDGLGLSAKGKRDLRWRAPTERAAGDEPDAPVKLADVRRIRAVDPAGTS